MPARLEAVVGAMFTGKSSVVAHLVEMALIAGQNILALKPKRDDRERGIWRRIRRGKKFKKVKICNAIEIDGPGHLDHVLKTSQFDILVVDECQFFPGGDSPVPGAPRELGWFARAMLELLKRRARDDLLIVVAGLDLDSDCRPFGAMPELMAIAFDVQKASGVCMNPSCRTMGARFSRYKGGSKEQIVTGDAEAYELLCLFCYATKC